MTYDETLTYLYTSQPAFHLVGAKAYKPGFDNTNRLMEHLGNPHTKLRAVHVAGTNGKGSTSHLIAAALQAAGHKVGLYTSPHLIDFRERIRIDGEMIAEQDVVDFVATHQAFLDELKPSFFETTMAMAFDYFVRKGVDVAVIEVGLGGRLDSTNVLPPYNAATDTGVLLSVITNIGFDHTEFLGNTLAAIAAEKAGIMKVGVPCVIGETQPETVPVFVLQAAQVGCPLFFADQSEAMPDIPCELTGDYQAKNKQTAYTALKQLGNITEDDMHRAWRSTGLHGRWETLATKPLTICDTGHNSHGIRTYIQQLRQLQEASLHNCSQDKEGNSHLRIVFGMVQDKDVDEVMDLLPKEAFYYWTQGQTHRAIPAQQMRLKGLSHGLIGTAYDTVEQAIRAAQAEAGQDDIIFIGGSNYVVGEALCYIQK